MSDGHWNGRPDQIYMSKDLFQAIDRALNWNAEKEYALYSQAQDAIIEWFDAAKVHDLIKKSNRDHILTKKS